MKNNFKENQLIVVSFIYLLVGKPNKNNAQYDLVPKTRISKGNVV